MRHRAYRGIWIVWLGANVSMWMSEVAAVWIMLSLDPSPLMVSLVPAAAAAPIVAFGLAAGALADQLDRWRLLLWTQAWSLCVALLMFGFTAFAWMSPPVLLLLVLLAGIGVAARWPVLSAQAAESVDREEISSAVALNSVAMNLSRMLGPLLAGAMIAVFGPASVFLLLMLVACGSVAVLLHLRSEPRLRRARRSLSGGMWHGILTGLRFIGDAPGLQRLLLHAVLFFLHAVALLALAPMAALQLSAGGPGAYTALLSGLGCGAMGMAALIGGLRQRLRSDRLMLAASFGLATAMVVVGWSTVFVVSVAGMVLAGASWISISNTLAATMHLQLPDGVRARVMSVFQICMMAGTAAGATLWGTVAQAGSVRLALLVAAASIVLVSVGIIRKPPTGAADPHRGDG